MTASALRAPTATSSRTPSASMQACGSGSDPELERCEAGCVFRAPVSAVHAGHLAHLAAAFGAGATNLGAGVHFIVVHHFAGLGARIADVGAGGADHRMHLRSARHEIGGRLADLDTVFHDADMRLLDVMSALREAVIVE